MRALSPQRWELRVYAGRDPLTGRKRYVSRVVQGTRREAESTLARLVSSTEDQGPAPADTTVRHLLVAWLETCGDDLSPTTLREYRRMIETRIIPGLGDVPLRKLQPAQVDHLYTALRTKAGLSPGTIRKVHAILHRAFGQAVRWGWVQHNVIDRTSPPRLVKAEHTPPDPQQVAELIDQAWSDDPAFGLFLHLAAVTGARRGELCGLRWTDIDFDDRSLIICRSVIDVDGAEVKDTKTHAIRRLALDVGAVALLVDRRKAAEETAAAFDVTLDPDAYLFSFEPDASRPVRPDGMTKRFVSLAHRVGIKVRLHDLRHFAATNLLAGGVPVRTVSGRLGHADAAMTLNVYGHFIATSDRAAADIVGTLVTSAREASAQRLEARVVQSQPSSPPAGPPPARRRPSAAPKIGP